jgi:hypothetical protein
VNHRAIVAAPVSPRVPLIAASLGMKRPAVVVVTRHHRGWRAPLPRRKSTNPPGDSCDREVTLHTSNCWRNQAGPPIPPLSFANRPTLIAAVMAILVRRLRRAACPSEIAVMEPPFKRTSCLNKAYMKLKKSVLFEFQNETIINLEKNVVFQQLPRGDAGIFWRQTVLELYCYRLP